VAKRLFILFWLFAAYTVVFAHSVVPHQHHEEEHAKEAHHHHHDDGNDHSDDSHDSSNTFHLFQHQGATGDDYVPSFEYKTLKSNPPVVVITHKLQQLIRLCDEGPPLMHFKKELQPVLVQQEYFYFHSVKAPPAMS
jgi:hypothetical protein